MQLFLRTGESMAFVNQSYVLVGNSSARLKCCQKRVFWSRRVARCAASLRASASTEQTVSFSGTEGNNLETVWAEFAARMKSSDESPPLNEWHGLFELARANGDSPAQAIWILERLQQSGRKATAATYEILLEICLSKNDRAAAFLLVEKMWNDKVLLGDVSLPEDMERTLRAILPPEAFD